MGEQLAGVEASHRRIVQPALRSFAFRPQPELDQASVTAKLARRRFKQQARQRSQTHAARKA
jgi:hypothetical protein